MQNTTTSNAALAAAFSTFNGCTFASIDTLTDVLLTGGKSNPLQGRVTKLNLGAQVILGASGALYENRVNRLLAAEFGDSAPKFNAGARPFGNRVGNSPVIVSVPKSTGVETFYLEAVFVVKPKRVTYLVDGVPATDEQVAQIKATLPKKSAPQAGLSEGVTIRTFKFDSLIRVRMGGNTIVANPDALKVVEAVAEAVAEAVEA